MPRPCKPSAFEPQKRVAGLRRCGFEPLESRVVLSAAGLPAAALFALPPPGDAVPNWTARPLPPATIPAGDPGGTGMITLAAREGAETAFVFRGPVGAMLSRAAPAALHDAESPAVVGETPAANLHKLALLERPLAPHLAGGDAADDTLGLARMFLARNPLPPRFIAIEDAPALDRIDAGREGRPGGGFEDWHGGEWGVAINESAPPPHSTPSGPGALYDLWSLGNRLDRARAASTTAFSRLTTALDLSWMSAHYGQLFAGQVHSSNEDPNRIGEGMVGRISSQKAPRDSVPADASAVHRTDLTPLTAAADPLSVASGPRVRVRPAALTEGGFVHIESPSDVLPQSADPPSQWSRNGGRPAAVDAVWSAVGQSHFAASARAAADSSQGGTVELAALDLSALDAACAAVAASEAGLPLAVKEIRMDEGLGLFQAFELARGSGSAAGGSMAASAADPSGQTSQARALRSGMDVPPPAVPQVAEQTSEESADRASTLSSITVASLLIALDRLRGRNATPAGERSPTSYLSVTQRR